MSIFLLTCLRLSTCSCWSWPELHALLGSKVHKVKAAEYVDATGRLIGRRCVISNFFDSKCVKEHVPQNAESMSGCSLHDCICKAWSVIALNDRSMLCRSVDSGHHESADATHGPRNRKSGSLCTQACIVRSRPANN